MEEGVIEYNGFYIVYWLIEWFVVGKHNEVFYSANTIQECKDFIDNGNI